ncbi:MAG: hypothetical protein R8G66_31770 [Cytophagales bacterium]|nr:hypothetical protein [Cytophagales bacterium]
MKKIRITLLLSTLIACFLVTGCSENEAVPEIIELNGTYEGTFTVEYLNGGQTQSNPVTITFSDGTFTSTAGENRFPAGGSGTYEVGISSVIFTDVNIWTADFDWNLVLNGEYTVTVTGGMITLSARKNDVGVYTYELVR